MLSPRRAVAATAAAAAVWPGLALGGPPAASATDLRPVCADASLTDHAKTARAVFVGTVEDVARGEAPDGAPPAATGYVATVAVDRVYKPGGAMVVTTETVDVRTARIPGRCSLGPLQVGERYLVFAGLAQGDLVATGESGTAVAETGLLEDVEQLLGAGRPPVPPDAPVATFAAADTSAPVPFTRAALPGAVVALVSLLALVLVRRLGRPS